MPGVSSLGGMNSEAGFNAESTLYDLGSVAETVLLIGLISISYEGQTSIRDREIVNHRLSNHWR